MRAAIFRPCAWPREGYSPGWKSTSTPLSRERSRAPSISSMAVAIKEIEGARERSRDKGVDVDFQPGEYPSRGQAHGLKIAARIRFGVDQVDRGGIGVPPVPVEQLIVG